MKSIRIVFLLMIAAICSVSMAVDCSRFLLPSIPEGINETVQENFAFKTIRYTKLKANAFESVGSALKLSGLLLQPNQVAIAVSLDGKVSLFMGGYKVQFAKIPDREKVLGRSEDAYSWSENVESGYLFVYRNIPEDLMQGLFRKLQYEDRQFSPRSASLTSCTGLERTLTAGGMHIPHWGLSHVMSSHLVLALLQGPLLLPGGQTREPEIFATTDYSLAKFAKRSVIVDAMSSVLMACVPAMPIMVLAGLFAH